MELRVFVPLSRGEKSERMGVWHSIACIGIVTAPPSFNLHGSSLEAPFEICVHRLYRCVLYIILYTSLQKKRWSFRGVALHPLAVRYTPHFAIRYQHPSDCCSDCLTVERLPSQRARSPMCCRSHAGHRHCTSTRTILVVSKVHIVAAQFPLVLPFFPVHLLIPVRAS